MAENIGFIGLGNMGEPMAAQLLKAGYALRVYNRTGLKAAALQSQGAVVSRSGADVATPGGIVCTMVADDRALWELCLAEPSFVERLGPGGLHISHSTISPETSLQLNEHHRKYGVAYVAAPVFGRPEAAQAAKLITCLSGSLAACERAKPLLSKIGQATYEYGEQVAAANIVKLCGNFMIACVIETLAEASTLATNNGINPATLISMFSNTLFACPVYQGYGQLIASGRFSEPKFQLALGWKDIQLVLQSSAASHTPMPMASLLRDRFLAALAKGRARWDWSAIALESAESAGIDGTGEK